ncbi:MAG: fumarate hydratase [Candidatus Omnitrophota bacterium]|jgi:fumarate hydratase subunit alpha
MKQQIQKQIERIVKEANFSLRKDILTLLNKAYISETNKKARHALELILENAKIAKREGLAICQDTGLPIIFIEIGKNKSVSGSVVEEIENAVISSYKNNYLRASTVAPFDRDNPSYKGVISHLEFSPHIKGVKVTIFPKGFGSENKSRLKMFNPTVDFKKIEDFILESIEIAGPESCPPFVLGVGIGGTSDTALLLAKKALIGRVDNKNKDKFLDKLEKQLLNKINSLNIGPMGLGGKHTCLAVKIKTDSTHIAGLPVGVNISCHALRSASCYLNI